MNKIFLKYLGIIMGLAIIAFGVFYYAMTDKNIEREMYNSAVQQIEQVADMLQANEVELANLREGMREDYLAKARAFAYIIEKNPGVLQSSVELTRIKEILGVDEMHVIDENGILIYSTVPTYRGLDFHNADQTREFLPILTTPGLEIVQEVQPNAAEGKMVQYAGVPRSDKRGIVQIGMKPERYLQAKERNELNYIFSRIPMEDYWLLEAIDARTGAVVATTRPQLKPGHGGSDVSRKEDLGLYGGGEYFSGIESGYWWCIRECESLGLYLCMATDRQVLTERRNQQMIPAVLYMVMILFVMLVTIRALMKRKIIDGIDRIITALRGITEGNLDTVVREKGNPEFEELSDEINKMVEGLLHTTARISKIIDMVDAPIGSFEYMEDMSRVLTTNRLQSVMGLTDGEAAQLFAGKRQFFMKLQSLMRHETEEKGVYQVSEAPQKWLRIQLATENRRTFGIITDVTREMLEKEALRRERDYDTLTGLCNRRTFEQRVRELLEGKEDLREAAMIMIDLDRFKLVNDTYGHKFGDDYLRFTAEKLKEYCTENCIAGRRSGDEFYLFDYRCRDRDEIRRRLKNLFTCLAEQPIATPDGGRKRVELSAGLAFYEEGCTEYDVILKKADDMLYRVKREGRGYYAE